MTSRLVVLQECPYYHVRITLWGQERRWDLEAVNYMLPRDAPLPDGPSISPSRQPPDPLTADASGIAGSWHPGYALYCAIGEHRSCCDCVQRS